MIFLSKVLLGRAEPGEAEAQRGQVSCPRSERKWLREDLNLGFSTFNEGALLTSPVAGMQSEYGNLIRPTYSNPSSLRQ